MLRAFCGFALGLVMCAPASAADTPAPAAQPRPTNLHICQGYPPEAVRNSEEGKTKLAFTVKADGTIAGATVSQSSGSAALDQASLACVAGWTYAPATVDGKPVDMPWEVSVSWNLGNAQIVPPSALNAHACQQFYPPEAWKNGIEGDTRLRFLIGQDGRVTNIGVEQSSGNAPLDAAAVTCASGWTYTPATSEGQPVGMVWRANISWRLTDAPLPNATVEPMAIGAVHVCALPADKRESSPPRMAARFTVAADGSVKDVMITVASGDAALDQAAAACVARWRYRPAIRHGAAVEYAGWTEWVMWAKS